MTNNEMKEQLMKVVSDCCSGDPQMTRFEISQRLQFVIDSLSTDLCDGCGSGEGLDKQTCDRCGKPFCDDCGPHRDDDAPIDLCTDCCESV